jgi:hypothetical protein
MANSEAERSSCRFSPQPIAKNSGGDRILGEGLAKEEFCTNMFGLLNPKTTLNLC